MHIRIEKMGNLSKSKIKFYIFYPVHEISNNVVCATSDGSDKPAHTRSLISTLLNVHFTLALSNGNCHLVLKTD